MSESDADPIGLGPSALEALDRGALDELGPGQDLPEPGVAESATDHEPALDLDALDRARGDGPLLSEEESAALFDAIRSGAMDGHATRPASLGSAEEPRRRAQRRLDELAPLAAAELRDALLRAGIVPENIEASPSEVHPLESFTGHVASAAAVWTVRAGAEAVARVVLEPSLVTALLERRLGATDAVAGVRAIERAPSALELRVLEPVARAACARIVTPFVSEELVLGPPGRPGELGSPLAPCAVVTLLLTPRRGEPARVQVALLASSLGHDVGKTQIGARLRDVLPDVEVELAAVLGAASSTVRALLLLERGSVLRLDGTPDRPIEVRVDGVAVLRGMPVVKNGNLAIEVSP